MAITARHSAATGLRALSTKIDVTANNLANAETTAFKRSRVNFEDLMYLQLKQPGTTNSAGEGSPVLLVVPGCLSCRYIRSSKFTRLRLNAVVSALARLLAVTSIFVDNARSPVAAEWRAVMA